MLHTRTNRIFTFFCLLILLLLATVAAFLLHRQYCMDVPVITEDRLAEYTETSAFDVSAITFNGQPVAADRGSATLYISQSGSDLSHFSSLKGELKHLNNNLSLYFIRNDALENIKQTVTQGNTLCLVVSDGVCYQKFSVIISTLPVMNISGIPTHENEDNRQVYTGQVTLWTGFDPELKAYSTQNSYTQWHVRGATTAATAKKPWKLSLKDKDGNNNNINFLGLGSDDDWILNSLTMDDTHIKEKLFMDLWNQNAAAVSHNYQMSRGEYVEVVIDGKYLGLFLLQRRLDGKYLELENEDVLLKSTSYQASNAKEAYEFVSAANNPDEIYEIMQKVYDKTDCSNYNLYNLIDTNLFLQYSSAIDNFSLKNMYHVLKKSAEGYDHFLLPWDTDMSFGIIWAENIGFCYNYQASLDAFGFRTETPSAEITYPNYSALATARWKQLRETILSESSVYSVIDTLHAALTESASLQRNVALWGNRYKGLDSIENLKLFIHDRIAVMDSYYCN